MRSRARRAVDFPGSRHSVENRHFQDFGVFQHNRAGSGISQSESAISVNEPVTELGLSLTASLIYANVKVVPPIQGCHFGGTA